MKLAPSFILINLFGLALMLAFCFMAQEPLNLSLMGMQLSTSCGTTAILAYLFGLLVCGISITPLLKGKQTENMEKLKEWKDQDAKLAVEIRSDKEKQLEAKVATLEAALKQALGK